MLDDDLLFWDGAEHYAKTESKTINPPYKTLRSVDIRTAEMIENGEWIRAESASKGRVCRRSNDFC